MQPSLSFVKLQALGNDFVLIDARDVNYVVEQIKWQKLADRRLGIGCDQILFLRKPTNPELDAALIIINQDGSYAEQCGNGLRAVGRYLYERSDMQKKLFQVQLLQQICAVEVLDHEKFAADLGQPRFLVHVRRENLSSKVQQTTSPSDLYDQSICDEIQTYFTTLMNRYAWMADIAFVSMSNPHCVIVITNALNNEVNLLWQMLGEEIANNPVFPKSTNVEFVWLPATHTFANTTLKMDEYRHSSVGSIKILIHERGVGPTEACGSGACAAASFVHAYANGGNEIKVEMPGGSVWVRNHKVTGNCTLIGSAEIVFSGTYMQG